MTRVTQDRGLTQERASDSFLGQSLEDYWKGRETQRNMVGGSAGRGFVKTEPET